MPKVTLIVGGSMGGMIAQVFAARYQHRTKTLGVIFSSNNQPLLPPPGPKQLKAITTRPQDTSRAGVIANAVNVGRIIGSPAYPMPLDQAEADAAELIKHASESIARYKLPKAVVFRPTIVRSPAGKADYRWAKEQALQD